MNALVKTFLFILLACSIVGCKKESATSTVAGDYVIAGETGGFVPPNSRSTYYAISGTELKKDTTQPYAYIPTSVGQFRFTLLMPATSFAAVADVPRTIPAELLSKNNQHIGGIFPDAGYMVVFTSINGMNYAWYFEADQSASSAAIQQFVMKLRGLF